MESRQIFSVMLVFVLLGGTLFALRRGRLASIRGGISSFRAKSLPFSRIHGRPKSIVSLERLPLTPQHALHLIKIHDREVVVATHPHGCELLCDHADGSQP